MELYAPFTPQKLVSFSRTSDPHEPMEHGCWHGCRQTANHTNNLLWKGSPTQLSKRHLIRKSKTLCLYWSIRMLMEWPQTTQLKLVICNSLFGFLTWHRIAQSAADVGVFCGFHLTVFWIVLQRSVGHWDRSADNHVCWSHRRCDESVSGTWHQDVCLWSLRCFCQALGHQRRNVPANFHWPWVRHQRYLCKLHVHSQSVLHLRLH